VLKGATNKLHTLLLWSTVTKQHNQTKNGFMMVSRGMTENSESVSNNSEKFAGFLVPLMFSRCVVINTTLKLHFISSNILQQVQDQQEQTQPLKTSDVYHTKNLPARFDNPGKFIYFRYAQFTDIGPQNGLKGTVISQRIHFMPLLHNHMGKMIKRTCCD